MKTENQTRTRNITVLNRSTVKAFALKVSKEKRAGKFTRVSEEFLISCEAQLESEIRAIITSTFPADEFVRPDDEGTFLTRVAREKMEERFEERALRIIHNKVLRHPTRGCTLKD